MEAQMSCLAGKKLIVVGGGIAGLGFAIALRRNLRLGSIAKNLEPELKIYEKDSHEHAVGREGYSLSLRSDRPSTGIQTLQKLGIIDAMIERSITGFDEGGSFAVWDRDWNEILKLKSKCPPGLPVGGMRIARRRLRGVLIETVIDNGDSIDWGVACVKVAELSDGRLGVQLSNGATDECDILIVADGASSTLRGQHRPHDPLRFAGVCSISGIARFSATHPPEPIDRDWGVVLTGTGTSVFASPVDEHSAVWSLSYPSPEPREPKRFPLSSNDIELVLAEVRERGSSLPPLFSQLVDTTDPETIFVSNAMDKQPISHTTLDSTGPNSNIIFMGDANHAVSPFAGAGANLALMDGWDLAECLCKFQSVEAAVEKYDAVAVPRAQQVIRQSHFTIAVAHSTGWRYWFYVILLRLIKPFVLMKS